MRRRPRASAIETITPLPGQEMPPPKRSRFALSPINRRRWKNFKANRRGYWSLWIFLVLFVLSLFAEFIANDRPILASYKGEILFPVLVDYPEEKFGGFLAVTDYRAPFMQDEIEANGWMLWPPIRYSYRTVNNEIPVPAPAPPSWLLDKETRCSRYPEGVERPELHGRGTGTGSAPTTRRATCWRASSTASASRCCSASR